MALSKFGSATENADGTLVLPASIQAGDLIVLADSAFDDTGGVPTDFTGILNSDDVSATSLRLQTSYKIAVGTEGGTTITGMTSGGTPVSRKVAVVFRDSIGPITAVNVVTAGGVHQSTGSNPAGGTIPSASGAAPLIVCGAFTASNIVSPANFSPSDEVISNNVGANANVVFAYKMYDASPADVAMDSDDEGATNILQGFYIELTITPDVIEDFELDTGAFVLAGGALTFAVTRVWPLETGAFAFGTANGEGRLAFIRRDGFIHADPPPLRSRSVFRKIRDAVRLRKTGAQPELHKIDTSASSLSAARKVVSSE
ncbi:MAG: hypothetical protein AB7F22_07840 [Reyranella sp.]|uniref:hypothetical protein n=1 Tax=Reyranella sp. TaxID=1929291 RepID=UPI003D13D013